jgi:hypothetical protein
MVRCANSDTPTAAGDSPVNLSFVDFTTECLHAMMEPPTNEFEVDVTTESSRMSMQHPRISQSHRCPICSLSRPGTICRQWAMSLGVGSSMQAAHRAGTPRVGLRQTQSHNWECDPPSQVFIEIEMKPSESTIRRSSEQISNLTQIISSKK